MSEVVRLRISATPVIAGDLSVLTPTSASRSGTGGGAVTNVSPSGAANSDFSIVRLATVPEPATLALLGVGLLGLGTKLRRRAG